MYEPQGARVREQVVALAVCNQPCQNHQREAAGKRGDRREVSNLAGQQESEADRIERQLDEQRPVQADGGRHANEVLHQAQIDQEVRCGELPSPKPVAGERPGGYRKPVRRVDPEQPPYREIPSCAGQARPGTEWNHEAADDEESDDTDAAEVPVVRDVVEPSRGRGLRAERVERFADVSAENEQGSDRPQRIDVLQAFRVRS